MKRIAGMATIAGRERALVEACESLSDQVDEIYVFANPPYDRRPALPRNVLFCTDDVDLVDAGKFAMPAGHLLVLEPLADNDLFLSVDDDLVYPAYYADMMAAWLLDVGRGRRHEVLATLHGKILPPHPVDGFYHDESIVNIHNQQSMFIPPVPVDVPGTGCSAMYGRLARRLDLDRFNELRCAADLHVGRFLKEEGAQAYAVPHPAACCHLSSHIDHYRDTIWADYHENDSEHAAFVNKYLIKINSATTVQEQREEGWFPSRPLPPLFVERLRAAWLVLSGKADAVLWP